MTCTTHHRACECREAKFAASEAQREYFIRRIAMLNEENTRLHEFWACSQRRLTELEEANERLRDQIDQTRKTMLTHEALAEHHSAQNERLREKAQLAIQAIEDALKELR